MTFFQILLLVVMTMLAVSFAWGMRGDLIGGEEGAMLPGGLLGFFVAIFLGKEFFADNALKLVALGMVGMFMGGTEPYAQTFDYTYWNEGGIRTAQNLKKGFTGLALKGAAWFGICAAVLGMGVSAMSGRIYSSVDLIILFVLLPVVRYAGTKLINSPHDPDNGVLPKIYFSKTSREEWGGLLSILSVFIVFEILKCDWSSLVITVFGIIGGSIGWIISQFLQCFTLVKNTKGKYVFGKYQEKGWIDNWKIMEFSFGALGSLSIIAGFITVKNTVWAYASDISLNGVWSCFGKFGNTVLFILWLILFIADLSSHFLPQSLKKVKDILGILHRPMLCYIPMLLVFLGNTRMSVFMAVAIMFWLAPEELTFVQLERYYNIKIPGIITAIYGVIVSVISVFIADVNLKIYFPLVCLTYILCASTANIVAFHNIDKNHEKGFSMMKKMSGTFYTVKGLYIILIIITSLFVLFY